MATAAPDEHLWGATVMTNARDVDSLYDNVWRIMMRDEKTRRAVEHYAKQIQEHAKEAIYKFTLTTGTVRKLVDSLREAGGMHLARLAQERKVVRMRNQRLLRINSLVNNSLRKTLLGMFCMSVCYLLVGVAIVAVAFGISRGTEYQVYDTMTVTDPSIDVCSCGVNPDTCLGVEVAQHVSLADGHSQVTVVACLGHGSTVTATFVAQGFGSASEASTAIKSATSPTALSGYQLAWNASSVDASPESTPSLMPGGPVPGSLATWLKRAVAVAAGLATAIPMLTTLRYAVEVQWLACLGVGGWCSCLRSWSCCRISRHVGSKAANPRTREFPELSYAMLRTREVLVDAVSVFGGELHQVVDENDEAATLRLSQQARAALCRVDRAIAELTEFTPPTGQQAAAKPVSLRRFESVPRGADANEGGGARGRGPSVINGAGGGDGGAGRGGRLDAGRGRHRKR